MYSADRFRVLKIGSTTVEFACVSGLLVIVPMNLRQMTIEEHAAALDALDDELTAAMTEKRRIEAAISAAGDDETQRLLVKAVRVQADADRLMTRWKNLVVPDDIARSAAREKIKLHLYQRTTPTRTGPVFEHVPGFREQKAYIVAAWVLVATFAGGLLPLATASVKWLRIRRRRRRGRCCRCNYSLQGLTEPRCPECGTAFDPSTA